MERPSKTQTVSIWEHALQEGDRQLAVGSTGESGRVESAGGGEAEWESCDYYEARRNSHPYCTSEFSGDYRECPSCPIFTGLRADPPMEASSSPGRPADSGEGHEQAAVEREDDEVAEFIRRCVVWYALSGPRFGDRERRIIQDHCGLWGGRGGIEEAT